MMPAVRWLFRLGLFALLVLPGAAQSTSNNTSACSANGVPTAGCDGVGVMPLLTNSGNTGAQTVMVDPLPVNTSTLNLHSYLYSGATTRVLVEYQPWFSNTGGFNGHVNIGMQESTAAQVLQQAQWMKTIGADVVDLDYYGCSTSCTVPQSSAQAYNLSVTTALASAIAANPSTTPKFMILFDEGAVAGTGTGQCPPAGGDQSSCLISAINTQMDYLAANWLFQSYYEVNANDSHPIVGFFIGHGAGTGYWPGTNFNTVFAAVAAHATSGQSCGSGCTYTSTVDFIDENAGGFSETGISGAYAWPQPNDWSSTNQFCYSGNPCSFNYLADFYSHARANPSEIAMGVIYKGFDDSNASWGSDRVIAQQCGQVLNLTAAAISTAGYSSSSQLQYVQFATWNDYEEGTGVEMGVNNCITVNQPTIASGNLNCSLTKSDATYGSTSTISSFSIYTGAGVPTTLFASGISPTATSHTAPTLSPGQSAWVYMVGQPLIQNQLSPARATTYYIAATGNDSNNGTSKTTPWLHAPGMSTFSGTYSCNPSDQFIFRGGDTWHAGNSSASPYTGGSWSFACAGTSGSYSYLGVDQTWFSGSSWVRPIFTGDNPPWTGSGFPASCAFDNSTMASLINLGSTNYVQVDNFEFTGACWTVNNSSTRGTILGNGQIKISNPYCHGWTMTSTADDNWPCWQLAGGTGKVEVLNSVVDGSDSPHFAAATVQPGTSSTPACQWFATNNGGIVNLSESSGSVVAMTVNLLGGGGDGPGNNWVNANGGPLTFQGLATATWLNGVNTTLTSATCLGGSCTSATQVQLSFVDPTSHGSQPSISEVGVAGMSGCASGQAINGAAPYSVHDNVFRYVSNVLVSNQLCNFSNNLVEDLYSTFASGSLQQHPNVANDLGACPTGPLIVSGNVIRHTFATEDIYLANSASFPTYVYNNVFFDEMNTIFGPLPGACFRLNNAPGSSTGAIVDIYGNTMGDASCQVQFAPANSPLLAFNGAVNFENGHFIGTTALSQNYNNGGGTATVTDNGGELFMTSATATTQGYVAANNYAPTLGTNSTIGAGNNLTSLCASFGTPFCSGTGGPLESSGSGGKIAVSPGITVVPRPSSGAWNAGAYQFASTQPLTVTISQNGSVTSSPSGISCPGTCSASFTTGTVVTLTATPTNNQSTFGIWSGACTGNGFCSVTMNAAQSVTAAFSINYPNAYTGIANVQFPVPTPNLGGLTGAGLCWNQPSFPVGLGGPPECRITDIHSDPSTTQNNTWEASGSGNAGRNLFSCGDNMLMINNQFGAAFVFFLNHSGPNLSISHVYPTGPFSSHGGWFYTGSSAGGWSYNCASTPNLLYLLNLTQQTEIDQYDFTTAFTNPSGSPTLTKTFDFRAGQTGPWGTTSANCLASNYNAVWNGWGEITQTPPDAAFAVVFSNIVAVPISAGVQLSVTNGSTAFTVTSGSLVTDGSLNNAIVYIPDVISTANQYNFASINSGGVSGNLTTAFAGTTGTYTIYVPSGQDTGTDIAVYVPGQGCTHLNTGTGAVTSDFGTVGTIAISDRFTLHGVRITPDGKYATFATDNCVKPAPCQSGQNYGYYWQLGTANVQVGCPVGGGLCGGHSALGYSGRANGDYINAGGGGAFTFMQLQERPYTNYSANNSVIPGLPWSTCAYSTPNFYDSHYSWNDVDLFNLNPMVGATTTTGAGATAPGTTNCPTIDEIDGIAPLGGTAAGTLYRFGLTGATGLSWNFTTQNSIGVMSSDGKYFMWGSDWQGTLGRSDNTAGTCVNSPNGASACRGDVFIMNLQAGIVPTQPVSRSGVMLQ